MSQSPTKDSGNVVDRAGEINFVFEIVMYGELGVSAAADLVSSGDLRNLEMRLR
jgi:hypothetical protein